jgi:fructokinase
MRDLDVVCLGEVLVDMLPASRGRLRDAESFSVQPGGAPSNVAVGLSRLGRKVGFLGVTGEDEFGHLLARKLAEEGVEAHLRFTAEAPTGLWFIALDERGDRSFFTPTRAGSADKCVATQDIDEGLLGRARWLHCGTSSHVSPGAQAALVHAVARAGALGLQVSLDPNLRPHLWKDPADLKALLAQVLPGCALVKLSDEEAEGALGVATPEAAADRLIALGVGLACVTLGPRGALLRRGNETARVPAPQVEVVDTTGAGDGFVAGLLSRLAEKDVRTAPWSEVVEAARFGCEVGAQVCTRLGAVAGLPRKASGPGSVGP